MESFNVFMKGNTSDQESDDSNGGNGQQIDIFNRSTNSNRHRSRRAPISRDLGLSRSGKPHKSRVITSQAQGGSLNRSLARFRKGGGKPMNTLDAKLKEKEKEAQEQAEWLRKEKEEENAGNENDQFGNNQPWEEEEPEVSNLCFIFVEGGCKEE